MKLRGLAIGTTIGPMRRFPTLRRCGLPRGGRPSCEFVSVQARTTLRRGFPVGIAVVVACICGFAHGKDPVAVLITGPLAAKTGERVQFEVELLNRSGQPLKQLRVADFFDTGFQHDASKSPIEFHATVDLAPDTSSRVTIEFLVHEPGRLCHRVEIFDQANKSFGGATACVQVSGPPLATVLPVAPPAETAPNVVAETTPPIHDGSGCASLSSTTGATQPSGRWKTTSGSGPCRSRLSGSPKWRRTKRCSGLAN
jgi:hypothetical protein